MAHSLKNGFLPRSQTWRSMLIPAKNWTGTRSFTQSQIIRNSHKTPDSNKELGNKDSDDKEKNKQTKKKTPAEEEAQRQKEMEDKFRKDIEEQIKKRFQGNAPNIKMINVDGQQIAKGALVISTVVLLLTFFLVSNQQKDELSFQDFQTRYLEKGLVQKLNVVNRFAVEAELIPGAFSDETVRGPNGTPIVTFTIGSIEVFEETMKEIQDKLSIPTEERLPILYVERGSLWNLILPVLPTVLLIGGLYYITAKRMGLMGANGGPGGIFKIGKSNAKLFNQETDVKIKFKDVAGCEESKEEIMEFVKFLQNPQKYEKLGAKIPRGAILSGSPGTGKTLLAKATAGEAGVPFLSVSGSEFVEMYVGVGASRVRDLFKTAREMAPAIIFVDEIDAIGRERGNGKMGGNDERENTLNQLLVEMDGFEASDHVVVLAGTNRVDILDKALLRPGRFDRHITIDTPDGEGRKAIFKVHLSKITLKAVEDIKASNKGTEFSKYKLEVDDAIEFLAGRLSALTPGFAGADIANCCNEGALIAARDDANSVDMHHFEQAIERVIAGLEKKSRILSPQEKKTVAYHEAGHAICGWFLQYADPLVKVSIIPRGQGALGYAQFLPKEQYLTSDVQFMHKIIMALGGRVSEELHFPTVTSGASDDFKKVTGMARHMVVKLGMSKRIGNITFDEEDGSEGFKVHNTYSESTALAIDEEVKRIIDEAYAQCKELLTEKLELVDKVAEEVYAKEVLTREDMIRLVGPRPFPDQNEAFDKYLKGQDAFKKLPKQVDEADKKGNSDTME